MKLKAKFITCDDCGIGLKIFYRSCGNFKKTGFRNRASNFQRASKDPWILKLDAVLGFMPWIIVKKIPNERS